MKMLAGVLFLRANAGGFYALLTKPRLRRTEKAVGERFRVRIRLGLQTAFSAADL
jgi:hypothetical protein